MKAKKRHLDAARELELLAKNLRQRQLEVARSRKNYERGENMQTEWLNGYYAGRSSGYEMIKYTASSRARQIRGGK